VTSLLVNDLYLQHHFQYVFADKILGASANGKFEGNEVSLVAGSNYIFVSAYKSRARSMII